VNGEKDGGMQKVRQKRKSKCRTDFCGVIQSIIQSVSKLYQQKPNKIRRPINSQNQKSGAPSTRNNRVSRFITSYCPECGELEAIRTNQESEEES